MNMSLELNQIIGLVAIAIFILPIIYMLGYARREKQHGDKMKECEKNVTFQRRSLIEVHNDIEAQSTAKIIELSKALEKSEAAIEIEANKAKEFEDRWKYADSYRKALVNLMVDYNLWDFNLHSDSPGLMMTHLLSHVRTEALDPVISKPAKNLFVKGVRKGAKQGREQMRKQMQKSIDNQAATIRHYDQELTNANLRRIRFTEAVTNVLNDKVALLSVRKSLKQALIVEHDRLRAVAAKQGE